MKVRLTRIEWACDACGRFMDVVNCEVGVRHIIKCSKPQCKNQGIEVLEPVFDVEVKLD